MSAKNGPLPGYVWQKYDCEGASLMAACGKSSLRTSCVAVAVFQGWYSSITQMLKHEAHEELSLFSQVLLRSTMCAVRIEIS